MRVALWLFISLAAVPLGANDPLTISVSPAVSMAPATFRVHVRLEPSAENRAIEIIAECADFYRSSEITLEGERGPATVELQIRDLPGGQYRVVAVLKDHAGRSRAAAARQVTVRDGNGPDTAARKPR